jgi:hypothetical protein
MLGLGLSISQIAVRSADGLVPPDGFTFLTDDDGVYLTDEAGTYIVVEAA